MMGLSPFWKPKLTRQRTEPLNVVGQIGLGIGAILVLVLVWILF